jgi:hypothetical protein
MTGAKMSETQQTEIQTEIENIAENNAKMSPEEIAASFFKQHYPSYKLLISKLNKKDALRLADALVGWPLEVTDPNFFSKNAKHAFIIANQLLDCKLIMRSAVELELMNKALTEKNTEEETSTVDNDNVIEEGEIDNGKTEA